MNRLRCGSLLVLTLATSGCGPTEGHRAALAETKKLQERIQFLQEDVARVTSEAKGAQRSIDSAREEATRREQETKAEREALQKKLNEVLKAFEEYQGKYRLSAQHRAAGQRLATLDGGAGRVFKDVEVLSITPGELRFRHASGLDKVPLGQLEASLRERFAYDPEKAAAWLAGERQKEVDEETNALIAETKAAHATVSRMQRAKSGSNGTRLRYQQNLNAIYASANALQADRNCCPVHKRYQLAEWSAEAARIKQRMAALPAGP